MMGEKEEIKAIIDKFDKSPTCLETYYAISDFVQAVFDMENFKDFDKKIEQEIKMLNEARDEIARNKRYYTNEERTRQTTVLHEMDTNFCLRNLSDVYFYLKPENFKYGKDWLFKKSYPNDPMPEDRKTEYRQFIEKSYKAILPFLVKQTEEIKEASAISIPNKIADIVGEKRISKVRRALKLTEDSKWEDIKIVFKNDFEVVIIANGRKYESDYEEMGFADDRKNIKDEAKAKACWELLKLFSIVDNNEFSYGILDTQSKRDKFKKNKQTLSRHLKNYFNIDEDPITYYKEKKIYGMKIKLYPESTYKEQWEDRNIIEREK